MATHIPIRYGCLVLASQQVVSDGTAFHQPLSPPAASGTGLAAPGYASDIRRQKPTTPTSSIQCRTPRAPWLRSPAMNCCARSHRHFAIPVTSTAKPNHKCSVEASREPERLATQVHRPCLSRFHAKPSSTRPLSKEGRGHVQLPRTIRRLASPSSAVQVQAWPRPALPMSRAVFATDTPQFQTRPRPRA